MCGSDYLAKSDCISILTRVSENHFFSFTFSTYIRLLRTISLEVCMEKLFQRGIIHFILFEICVGGLFDLDLVWKWLSRARWLLFGVDSFLEDVFDFFRTFVGFFSIIFYWNSMLGWFVILKFVWEQLSHSISTAFRFWLVFLKPVFWLSRKNGFRDLLSFILSSGWNISSWLSHGIKVSTQNCLEFLDGGHFVFDSVWEQLSRSLSTVLKLWFDFWKTIILLFFYLFPTSFNFLYLVCG